jgi:hypothetical protein
MLKKTSKYGRNILENKLNISFPVPPALLVDGSAGRIARELW